MVTGHPGRDLKREEGSAGWEGYSTTSEERALARKTNTDISSDFNGSETVDACRSQLIVSQVTCGICYWRKERIGLWTRRKGWN